MSQANGCVGHKERENRKTQVAKFVTRANIPPDGNFRALIKKGPISLETSLRELEQFYEKKAEWKVINNGRVLSVPVEELRMEKTPQPNHSGQITFREKKGGGGKQIEYYPIAQTIHHMNRLILYTYEEEEKRAMDAGLSPDEAKRKAFTAAGRLPQLKAVQAWQDIRAEIKLKDSMKKMMTDLKIPALLIRSISLKQMSALNDLGLSLPEDAEIDLMLAYCSGDFLHIVVCEVKRSDTFPWDLKPTTPNRQAVNKAEGQLTKDLEILIALLAGIPTAQIIFHTLACFPDSSVAELQTIFCYECLENGIVCQEDLDDMILLQKKTQVPERPHPATIAGRKSLLTLTARCLSQQSLLHIGYREIADKEHLVSERHKFNIKSVDGKMMQSEYVVASHQQQQAISNFTTSPTRRHLVLTGAAGTGKTVVALKVANNIVKSLEETSLPDKRPVLIVTAEYARKAGPLLTHLDVNTVEAETRVLDDWEGMKKEYEILESDGELQIILFTIALDFRWKGRPVVVLIDEIYNPEEMVYSLADHFDAIPASVTIIAVVNPLLTPALCSPLPEAFLRIDLTVPYRSTVAITSFVQFITKCQGYEVPEGDFGSDVQGTRPIIYDVGEDDVKLREALEKAKDQIKDGCTLLYDNYLPTSIREICKSHGKDAGGPWDCYNVGEFYGWESDKVVVVTSGGCFTLEMASRAKTELFIILFEPESEDRKQYHAEYRNNFERAADEGLVTIFKESN